MAQVVVPSHLHAFWREFAASSGGDVSARFYEAFHIADSEPIANGLADLVLLGVKRAGAGLLWSNEAAGTSPPEPGNLSILTNWAGEPLCVIETIEVQITPFEEVSAEFAATEGEGDGSLEYWRQAHWSYFGRECARIGKQPSATMPVVCERFKVVYRHPREPVV